MARGVKIRSGSAGCEMFKTTTSGTDNQAKGSKSLQSSLLLTLHIARTVCQ